MFHSLNNSFLLGCVLLQIICTPQEADALPSGFIAEPITSKNAITGAFANNPRNDGKPMLILVDNDGTVSVMEGPDESSDSTEILEIKSEMCMNGERGMQSIAVHPDFEENRYIYLYWNKYKEDCLADDSEDGPWNVVSRFTMDPDTLMLDFSERKDIWRGAPLHDSMHNGGAMAFGNDGKLYITTGDGGTPENSQDRRNNLGNLIRLEDDGSVPNDNPYTKRNGYESYPCHETEGKVPNDASDDAICSEIFAHGLRNPFRISMDPNEKEKTLFAISDVGGKTWEEINYAGTDYMGVNYGYKEYEGPCYRHSDQECPIPTEFEEPFYWYLHREKQDGCVAGSTFVPEGVWPEEYKFLFIDFVWYNIYNLIEDTENGCRTCLPPIPNFRNETFHHSIRFPGDGKNEARMIDMFFGPYKDTQALYVVKFGNHDTVLRIRYTGIHNEPPLVKFEFEDKPYDVGEQVLFDGSLSEDPEGEELTFRWFFGDGGKSDEKTPTHSFNETGAYKVTLIVSDSLNQLQELSKTIQVGTPPAVNIISPTEGDEFYVGQKLRLKGQASYANGTAVDNSNLEWEVIKHHSNHFHPFLAPTFGNDFDLYPAPNPEDFYASLNSYLEISLKVTDEKGLVGKTNRMVQPTLIMINVTSNLDGTRIRIEDEPITMPQTIWGWKQQEINMKAENTPPFVFESWSDGVRDKERFTTLDFSTPPLEARFCVDDGGACAISTSCCIGECNSDGICAVPVKLPSLYLDTSPPPTMASTPAKPPAPLPTLNMSASGKAMLSITCLLIGGILASFVYWWKFRDQRIARRNMKPQPTHWWRFSEQSSTQSSNPSLGENDENDSLPDYNNASTLKEGQDAIVNSVTSISSSAGEGAIPV